MNEELLHFIWKFRLYSPSIQTLSGNRIEVLSPGLHNKDAGPDFLNARVRIGTTEWVGNVEIHVRSSDWYSHGHHLDDSFRNVILHVVYENNQQVIDSSGNPLETLVLKDVVNENIFRQYQYLIHNQYNIPCEKIIHKVSSEKVSLWLNRVMVERLERKSAELEKQFVQNQNNFEETLYQVLAGNFGMKVNRQPFEMLAKRLPLKVILKHAHSLFQLEAILFGVAGFLEENFQDNYPNALKKEFEFLRKKYSLNSIPFHIWKFLRLRPNNFPTIRLAQFAAVLQRIENLFSMIRSDTEPEKFLKFFDVSASEYWNNHYRFDELTESIPKRLGKEAGNNLIINTVVLMMFFYGKVKGEEQLKEKALVLLQMVKAENNSIIRQWAGIGIPAENAFDTQALIELKNRYCNLKRCLDCSIGLDLIKESMDVD